MVRPCLVRCGPFKRDSSVLVRAGRRILDFFQPVLVRVSLTVREAGGDTLSDDVARSVEQNGHLHRGQCRAVKSSGEFYIRDPWTRTVLDL